MNIEALVKLTSRAWSLDILSLMTSGTAGRQAALLAASGASRGALSQSLSHLIDLGLLERNPGHGHPLRPEYRLTAAGQAMGRMAQDVQGLVRAPDDLAVLRRAWTLPVLAVSQQPRRFGDIRADLGPITDRALSQALQHLQGQDWLDRRINPEAPVLRPLYQAANTGLSIAQVLARAG